MKKIKNIVLLDVWANYLESVLSIDDINVEMLVVDRCFMGKCQEKYDNKIKCLYHRTPDTIQEFENLNKSDYNLTYTDIERYRSTQLKCEHYLQREILDYAVIQYRYYLALKFWLGFFANNKIDVVIVCHLEHGALWDSIIIDIAKSKNIPVYNISVCTNSKDFEINCVINLNNNTFLNIGELQLTQIDFLTFFENLEKTYKFFSKLKVKSSNFNLLQKLQNTKKYIKYNIKNYLLYKKYNKSRYEYIFWDNLKEETIYKSTKYIECLKKHYDKVSQPGNYKQQYIYYPLHQEPEATISVRGTMHSQLFIIQQISSLLPLGWKLYVKEHPSTFSIYEQNSYYLNNIQYFRTAYFYNHIERLPNVELVDINESGRELILHSQCVCSICGTSLLESAIIGKPILVFGVAMNVIELLRDAMVINSTLSLKKAINKLQQGFNPNYDDLEEIYKKYTFSKSHYESTNFATKNNDIVKLINFILKVENRQ